MKRFLLMLAMLAAPGIAHADRMLDRVLADNPPVALLARRVDKIQLDLTGCDYFGENNTAACTQHMDAKELTWILGEIHAPSGKDEHLYCTSYNQPLVADRGYRPLTGFKCWTKTEMSSATIELTCETATPGGCTLHYRGSNDDEDTDYRYDFRVVGRGKAMAIENDTVHFSYETNN